MRVSVTSPPVQVPDAVLMAMAPLVRPAQMYITVALVLDGEAPEPATVAAHVEQRVCRVPGLSHRYVERAGRPVWQAQEVIPAEHVAPVRVDGDGDGPAGIDALMERVREHVPVHPGGAPMWDILVATGFSEKQWALVFRCHHSQMDGGAITNTLDQLFGPAASARRRGLWRGAVRPGLAQVPLAAATVVRGAARTAPWPAPCAAAGTGDATYAVTNAMDLDALRKPGATLTQVFAACFAVAADSWWPLPGDRRVHVVVPVDLREPGEQRGLGNHFAPLRVALPTGSPDEVLEKLVPQMASWRSAGFRQALDVIRQMTPFPAQRALGSRIASGACCRAVVSSIASRNPLSFQGVPVVDLIPSPPTFPGHAVTCVLWSYDRNVRVAFGSHSAMPAVDALPAAWEQALKSLCAADSVS